jgi:Zinc finger, C2H2 type
MICDPCLKELNGAYWLRARMRNAEESCFAKRREEFETAENEESAAVAVAPSPRVKREASVEIMDLPVDDQRGSEVKKEPANDNIMIESDEMEAADEETEIEDDEQVKMETETTKNKLQKVTKKQVKDAFEKLAKKKVSKKAVINHCPICDKTFSKSGNLRQHIEAVHEKKTRFNCTHCPKSFYRKFQMQDHIAQCHTFTNDDTTNSNRPFECDIDNCGKFYKTKNELKKHQMVHSGK